MTGNSSNSGSGGAPGSNLDRIVVGVGFLAALVYALSFDIPQTPEGTPDLPDVALGRETLFRVEVLLLLSFGGLLLLTPLYYGLLRGKLPIEVSARGARYAEATEEAIGTLDTAIERLQEDVKSLRGDLVKAQLQQQKDGDA